LLIQNYLFGIENIILDFKSLKLTPKLNGKWQLLEEVVYTVGYKGSADRIVVPQGFETD
jgi:hypothetical protein